MDNLPQEKSDSPNIVKPEFQNIVHRLGYQMTDEEFEKLWMKYVVILYM